MMPGINPLTGFLGQKVEVMAVEIPSHYPLKTHALPDGYMVLEKNKLVPASAEEHDLKWATVTLVRLDAFRAEVELEDYPIRLQHGTGRLLISVAQWGIAVPGQPAKPVYVADRPHRCPACNGRALILFTSINCSSIGCRYFALGGGR